MKRYIAIILVSIAFVACNEKHTKEKVESDACCNQDSSGKTRELSCKLMSAELQKRKETVLADLRKQVIERKELENGYAFKFTGDDKTIDKLTNFIKTERHCCDFFAFNLSITGDTTTVWMEITGETRVKEFIQSELEL